MTADEASQKFFLSDLYQPMHPAGRLPEVVWTDLVSALEVVFERVEILFVNGRQVFNQVLNLDFVLAVRVGAPDFPLLTDLAMSRQFFFSKLAVASQVVTLELCFRNFSLIERPDVIDLDLMEDALVGFVPQQFGDDVLDDADGAAFEDFLLCLVDGAHLTGEGLAGSVLGEADLRLEPFGFFDSAEQVDPDSPILKI